MKSNTRRKPTTELILGGKWISATELVNFTKCRHIHTLTEAGVKREDLKEDKVMIFNKGNDHEKAFFDSLKDCFSVPKEGLTPEQRHEETIKAMKNGYKWIYHGYLLHKDTPEWGRHGEIDFMERVAGKSALGDYHYIAYDTKLGESLRASYMLQLCHYSDLIEIAQGRQPAEIKVVPGKGEVIAEKVSDYIYYYRNLLEQYKTFIKSKEKTEPYPIKNCDFCQFQKHCQEYLETNNHISLTQGISRAQASAVTALGIKKRSHLAKATENDFKKRRGISRDGFLKLIRQASVQESGKELIKDRELLATLPEPADGDLVFDMESDNFVKPNGLEYLFGFLVLEKGKPREYVPFWAKTKAEEKQAFIDAMDYMKTFFDTFQDGKIFHYGSYEPTHLHRLSCQYDCYQKEVDDFLRESRFVDLYRILQKTIVMPTPSLSLKDLEPVYKFERKADVKSGGSAMVLFENFLETGNEDHLKKIELYNEEDVQSTASFYEWLRGKK